MCRLDMRLICNLLVTTLIIAGFSLPAFGQMDPDLQKNPPPPFEGTRAEAMERFLDASRGKRQRYAAGLRLVEPTEAESAKLLEFAANPVNDPDLRLLAIARHPSQESSSKVVIDILRDPKNEKPEFVATLVEYANRWFFVKPTSDLAKSTTFALRKRLDDENELVRIRTFEGLASMGDAKAVELVVRQLKGTGDMKIPNHLAAEYLRQNDPRKHLGVFKVRFEQEVAKDQRDPELLSSLVKALAIDAEQHAGLVKLAREKKTDAAVKRSTLDALAFYHAKGLPEAALDLMNDPNEDSRVRGEAARSMLRFLNRGTNEEKDKHSLPYAQALKKVLESNQDLPNAVKEDFQEFQKSILKVRPQLEERLK